MHNILLKRFRKKVLGSGVMTRKPSIMWRALEVLKEEKRLTTGMLAKKLGVSQPRASQNERGG
ncbi:MAG: hypothetical protein DRP02_14220 [Candidatus Gerdarchaeota archaeon]|nr:MAG: hypothetical protein DRP02_14220 [Candidatus Gerdarchaeota archaeon]